MVRVQCSKCGADILQLNYHSDCPCNKCGNKSGAFIDKETRKLNLDSLNEDPKEKIMVKADKKELARILDEVLSKKDSKFMCRIIYDLENTEPTIDVRDNKPTIIKSGDTWVAEYDGVDYLIIDGIENFRNIFDNESYATCQQVFLRQLKFKEVIWKPISEIEITDEIALLRPIVIGKYSGSKIILYGVFENKLAFLDINGDKKNYRLATVKDLKNV